VKRTKIGRKTKKKPNYTLFRTIRLIARYFRLHRLHRVRIGAFSRLKTLGRLPGRDGPGDRVRDSSDQVRDLRGAGFGPTRQALLEEEGGGDDADVEVRRRWGEC
jgi:hypothetical protein